MAVTISGVTPHSPAARARIKAGDVLLTVNGHEIADVLDYRFYMLNERLTLTVQRAKRVRTVRIRKEEDAELGLEFESYLMDEQRSCRNKCIFCFIDQLPDGMRDTLYFKDDDSRLSFLFGNYITLTNLTEHEIERIIAMHISPVNISVHTTDPALRCRMMNNRFAGDALQTIYRFAEAGLAINCQLVLCPGWNDGEALSRTLRDLAALAPAVRSVAAVPVGLTAHREGLEPLRLFTKEEAADVIDRMEAFAPDMLEKTGTRLFYPSDEFFITSGRKLPDVAYYDEFYQLENGVGMLSSLIEEFRQAVENTEAEPLKRRVLCATGKLAAPFLQQMVDEAAKKWHNLDVTVVPIANRFFGETITVAGLVTGGDMIDQLCGQKADVLLFPRDMLRSDGDLFLDDVTPTQLSEALGMPVRPVCNDGYDLLDALLGVE